MILQPLPVPSGPAVHALLPDLEAALTGTAAWLPVPINDSRRRDLLLASQRPGAPITDTALVVPTSGSTGTPKGSQLSASNLLASAKATAKLIGHGQWLLALPADHIAGLQVLLRSILTGTTPAVVTQSDDFASAAATMTGSRRLTSIVPLQLSRLLADEAGVAALQSFDAILCGGQATPAALVRRAREQGINIVLTYGSSETAGGCVYDGEALAGVKVEIASPDEDGVGRIELTGPMVAHGYRNRPQSTAFRKDGAKEHTFITSDLGRLAADGTLEVLGRADDVINSGGLKVLPRSIESVLTQHPDVAACVVVGLPEATLGEQVVAVVSLRQSKNGQPQLTRWLRERVHHHLVPRHIVVVDQLPTLGPGKIDRAAAREIARVRI